MVYDQDISDTVSVSEVLDCFLIDNSSPSVIIKTLQKYSDIELRDIFFNSTCYIRMFDLHFISLCGYDEKRFLYSQLKNIDDKVADYFVWQVLKSNLDDMTKNIFRHHLQHCRNRHPYHGFIGRNLQAFDLMFFSGNSIESIAKNISSTQLSLIGSELDKSLFVGRMLQYDFFGELDYSSKFVIMKALIAILHNNAGFVYPFMKQVLTSDEDIRIKFEIFSAILKSRDTIERYVKMHLSQEIIDIINRSNGYEEVMISLQLMGEEVTDDMLIYLVLKNKITMAMGILDDETLGVKDKFPVAEFMYTTLKLQEKKNKRDLKTLVSIVNKFNQLGI